MRISMKIFIFRTLEKSMKSKQNLLNFPHQNAIFQILLWIFWTNCLQKSSNVQWFFKRKSKWKMNKLKWTIDYFHCSLGICLLIFVYQENMFWIIKKTKWIDVSIHLGNNFHYWLYWTGCSLYLLIFFLFFYDLFFNLLNKWI